MRILPLLLAALVFCAPAAAAQSARAAGYKVSAAGRGLVVRHAGKRHRLDAGALIDAARVREAEVLFATPKDGALYLVIDVFGDSRADRYDRQCGAGSEGNLIWLRLDRAWRVLASESIRYESCWSSIDMGDGVVVTGRRLRAEFENYREDLRVTVTYDADAPEQGFRTVKSSLEGVSKP